MSEIDLSLHNLVFCKDSVLRFEGSFKEKAVLYPLEETLNYYNKRKSFFLRVLNNPIKVEKGATISNIILSLMPWADLIEDLTDRNIRNYAKACRRLSTREQCYERIVLSNDLAISRNCTLNDDNVLEYGDDFLSERIPNMYGIENLDDTESVYDLSGGIFFDQIKNTPVFVSYRHKVFIHHNCEEGIISCEGFTSSGKNATYISDDDISLNDFIQAFFVYGLYKQDPRDENSVDNVIRIYDLTEDESPISLATSDGEVVINDNLEKALSALSDGLEDLILDDEEYYGGLLNDSEVKSKIIIGEVEYSEN